METDSGCVGRLLRALRSEGLSWDSASLCCRQQLPDRQFDAGPHWAGEAVKEVNTRLLTASPLSPNACVLTLF